VIVLDTNVVSEVFKPTPELRVLEWWAGQPRASRFITTVTLDHEAADDFADIAARRGEAGRPISQLDAMVAAMTRSRDASLATRNPKDCEGCGIEASKSSILGRIEAGYAQFARAAPNAQKSPPERRRIEGQSRSPSPARVLIFAVPVHSSAFFKDLNREVRTIPDDLAKVPAIGRRHGIEFMPAHAAGLQEK
jgi:predicted nucleic acid-binding protein